MGARLASVALVAGFSLVAGLGAGRFLFHEESRAPTPAGAPAPVPAELLELLRELQRSVDALTGAIESAARTPSVAVREPVTDESAASATPQPDSRELSAVLRELSAAIAGLPRGATKESTPEELKIPARVDRDAAFAAWHVRETANADQAVRQQAIGAFRVAHLFRSTQDILSTYGAPEGIDLHP